MKRRGGGATLSGGGRPREDAHGYPRTAIMCRKGETVGLGGPAGSKILHVRSQARYNTLLTTRMLTEVLHPDRTRFSTHLLSLCFRQLLHSLC